jgi:cyclopropane-fatty-acyl-phospholipid synthase
MITALGSILLDKGLLPDSIIAWGIRRLCRERLEEEGRALSSLGASAYLASRIETLNSTNKIAILTDKANEQHYEVPASFFLNSLGARLKYSSCYYPNGNESLDQAEEEMLKLYEQRAEIQDGMSILELGCGWGSLTLWLAQRFPASSVTGVSNSNGQREFILSRARELGLNNVEIITADINELELSRQFDRIVSVEMFEHLRNYELLFKKIAGWMSEHSKMFVHIFCHKTFCYPYETEGASNWMGRYFFSGGYMPSVDLFHNFCKDLKILQSWQLDGTHYEKTSRHWLQKQDQNKKQIMKIFTEVYGEKQASIWFERWRVFYLACAELFGYEKGQQWLVTHYLFEKTK